MLWEVEIEQKGDGDAEAARVRAEVALLAADPAAAQFGIRSARGYLLEGALQRPEAETLVRELLVDPLVESGRIIDPPNPSPPPGGEGSKTVTPACPPAATAAAPSSPSCWPRAR